MAVTRETGERSRLMLDIAGFRAGRKAELEQVAKDAVAEAQRAGIEAERLRAVGILNRCAEHDVTRFAGDFIARGLSLPEVEERLDMLRRYTAGNGPELRPGITRSNSTGSWQAVIDKFIRGTNK